MDRLPDVHWWSERGKLRERKDFWQRIEKILARGTKTKQDLPFAEFLRTARITPDDRLMVARFVEGYHGADLEKVSTHSLAENDDEQEEDDNPQFRILTGYDSLLEVIRGGFAHDKVEVRTSTTVKRIGWRRGDVELIAINRLGREETHRAQALVITLPVGVLRSDPASCSTQM